MEEPKSLDSLFKEKIFRIPDYQRGFAWQTEQLKNFWEDLINLPDGRYHYTGVLTLKQIPRKAILETDKEHWLVEDHSYNLYHIVDGQQRLATFIIFLQAFVDCVKDIPEHKGKPDDKIYITDSLSVADLQSKYLFRTKPTGDQFRTYKFGYETDNPSYDYLRYKILDEVGGGSVQETFYTRNLSDAKDYFTKQFKELYEQKNMEGLEKIYKKLTKQFIFNEYIIRDEFDVFVAFETMNNRGKKLSNLELLKNRLIYLTTLYTDEELNPDARASLRGTVNDAWKEVYHQLGRKKERPLDDDEFLRAHWTMYFKYSRKAGRVYINFLLGKYFTQQRVQNKGEHKVSLNIPEEQRSDVDSEDENDETGEETSTMLPAHLRPTEIRDFVNSLRLSSVHWFNSYFPYQAKELSENEKPWIERLNRIGMGYFRPLVMSILKNEQNESKRIHIFKCIERFIFIVFRMAAVRSNYGNNGFFIAARELDRGDIKIDDIEQKLKVQSSFTFNENGTLRYDDFYNLLYKKFKDGDGYYNWSGLRYFLYEYERSLLLKNRQKKLTWDNLVTKPKDKISIEHIYPQTETAEWGEAFNGVKTRMKPYYKNTIGNLLLLSSSINSALQNDSFTNKKKVKYDGKKKIRNGYADGSHSEIEVAEQSTWGPEQIRDRGLKLLSFMEERWEFKFKAMEKKKLLFLSVKNIE